MTGAFCLVLVRVMVPERTNPEMSVHMVMLPRTPMLSCPYTGSERRNVPGGATGTAGETPISAMICGSPPGTTGGGGGGGGGPPVPPVIFIAGVAIACAFSDTVTVTGACAPDATSPGANDPGSGLPGHAGARAAGPPAGVVSPLMTSYRRCIS